MSSLNQINLIGNLGKDPEVLKVSDQGSFVRLSIATNRKYQTKEGEVRDDTQWHIVYLNNKLGKIAAAFLKKGAKVFVSGELRTEAWQDKKTGQTHYSTAVHAKEMKFLSTKRREEDENAAELIDEESAYEKAKLTINQALGRLPEENAV